MQTFPYERYFIEAAWRKDHFSLVIYNLDTMNLVFSSKKPKPSAMTLEDIREIFLRHKVKPPLLFFDNLIKERNNAQSHC